LWHKESLPRSASTKGPIVTYIRIPRADRRRIESIAKKRGPPHTIASVAAEMITRGLNSSGINARGTVGP
jgi:hypothetical protein